MGKPVGALEGRTKTLELPPAVNVVIGGVGESAEAATLSLADFANRLPGGKCPVKIFPENK